MSRIAILSALAMTLPLAACLTPIKDYHGYVVDDVKPADIKPGTDTRSSVLAQLGSPTFESAFDDNTWIYANEQQERLAYFRPKVVERTAAAIRFNDDDSVEEVGVYNVADGEVLSYASRETPTRGRELGLWEQIFGTIGNVRLPQTDEATPDNPTGRRN